MSLLNDTLSDLARSSKNAAATAAEKDLGISDSYTKEQRELFLHTNAARPSPRTLIPSIVVFVVVFGGFFAARYFANEKNIQPDPIAGEDIVGQHQETLQNLAVHQPVVSPELSERLAALESAVTTLTGVINTQQYVTEELEQEVLAVTDEPSIVEEGVSVSIKEPFRDLVMDEQVGNGNPTGEYAINKQPDNEPVTDDALLHISPSPVWQDQQFAAQARTTFQAGKIESTIAQLNEFITSHPAAQESTKLLLDILCEQESIASAQQVLSQSSFLHSVDQTYYRAKIALLSGEKAEAVALLESSLDEAQNYENYRALLAGLYQRSGMNQEAASHYRRLLNVFGEKPAYWLGFALAQDALNQSQLAFQAYQRVNQYSDLQPQVRQYVEQRLVALQQ